MLYDDLQEIVSDILSDPDIKQGTITLISVTPAINAQPWKPGAPTETPIALDGTVRGVSFKYVQKELALATDLQVTFAVPSVLPTMADYIMVNNERYKIVQIEQKPASGTPVAFTAIIRRG